MTEVIEIATICEEENGRHMQDVRFHSIQVFKAY